MGPDIAGGQRAEGRRQRSGIRGQRGALSVQAACSHLPTGSQPVFPLQESLVVA